MNVKNKNKNKNKKQKSKQNKTKQNKYKTKQNKKKNVSTIDICFITINIIKIVYQVSETYDVTSCRKFSLTTYNTGRNGKVVERYCMLKLLLI